jgi:MGT family glycosyltransferase
VHDGADLAAPPVAAAQGVPVVHHSFGAMVPLAALERAGAAVEPLWRELGLEPPPYAGAFGGLYVDTVPPALDGDRPLGPSVRLRPTLAVDGAAPAWLEGLREPLVYVTMGTVFNEGADFRPLLDALADVDVPALVTVGRDGDPGALGAVPAHVRVERFVPQGHVLPRCAAVLCHGGSGTVLGALAAGVPLVLLPQGADQFENADRCERAGVAVVLWPGEVTAAAVAAALRTVLRSPELGSAARALGAEIGALPDANEVASAVESWIARA